MQAYSEPLQPPGLEQAACTQLQKRKWNEEKTRRCQTEYTSELKKPCLYSLQKEKGKTCPSTSGIQKDQRLPTKDTHPPALDTVGAQTELPRQKQIKEKSSQMLGNGVQRDEGTLLLERLWYLPGTRRMYPITSYTQDEHFEDKYLKTSLIGTGGFSKVYAGIRKADSMPVAIKYISKQRDIEELTIPRHGRLPLEVGLMLMAQTDPPCENILQLLEWYEQPYVRILVLERPEPCKDLNAYCKEHGGILSESIVRDVMVQLIKALRHCKKCKILHRDVKPQNLLIRTDTLQVKLIDFGCGDLFQKFSYGTFAGTRNYAPPEWYTHSHYQAEPATVWSVGITLHKLLIGCVPWKRKTDTLPEHLSLDCRHLINWCTSAFPGDRPSLKQIGQHPWLNEADDNNNNKSQSQSEIFCHLNHTRVYSETKWQRSGSTV